VFEQEALLEVLLAVDRLAAEEGHRYLLLSI